MAGVEASPSELGGSEGLERGSNSGRGLAI